MNSWPIWADWQDWAPASPHSLCYMIGAEGCSEWAGGVSSPQKGLIHMWVFSTWFLVTFPRPTNKELGQWDWEGQEL